MQGTTCPAPSYIGAPPHVPCLQPLRKRGRALPQQVPASGVVKFSGPGPAKSGCEALLLAGRPTDAALTAPPSGVQLTTVLLVYCWLIARRCEKGRITLCARGRPDVSTSWQGASRLHALGHALTQQLC